MLILLPPGPLPSSRSKVLNPAVRTVVEKGMQLTVWDLECLFSAAKDYET